MCVFALVGLRELSYVFLYVEKDSLVLSLVSLGRPLCVPVYIACRRTEAAAPFCTIRQVPLAQASAQATPDITRASRTVPMRFGGDDVERQPGRHGNVKAKRERGGKYEAASRDMKEGDLVGAPWR